MAKVDYLKKAKEYAKSRGGECLATEYVSMKTKTHWKCGNPNHPAFETDFQIINRENWCVLCHREEVAKKYTLTNGLEKCHEHARKHGGQCLSTEYKNAKTKMKWQCYNNHTWESCYDHVVNRDRWCKQCHYEKAINQGFDILAEEYAKNKNGSVILPLDRKVKTASILTWHCGNNEHKSWNSSYHTIVQRQGWCPSCAGKFNSEEYLNFARQHAISKGGQCLSKEYIDQRTTMTWNCYKHGHWEDEYRNVVSRDFWCPKCREIYTSEEYLETAKKYAMSKGGKCLSSIYINQNTNMIWQCSKHGIWKSNYSNIVKNNRWCPDCFKEKQQKKCLTKAHDYAKKLGGICLTNDYNNSNDVFTWKCHKPEHKSWKSKYNIVLANKSWCPECGIYYQKENQFRKLLEYVLEFSLEKARPNWNINPQTGFLLELDGYNELKKTAFEYQGRHHYQDNVFKNSNQTLEQVQFKDKVKAQHCKERNIKLIIIDGRKKIQSSKSMITHILSILKKNNIAHNKTIDLNEVEKIYNEARINS